MLMIYSSIFQQKLTVVIIWMCSMTDKMLDDYIFFAIKWKQKQNSDSSSVFQLGSLSASVQPYVRNLGVTFDSLLNFKKQISVVVKGSFFHLRSIAELKQFLTHKDLEINAFIPSCLDYCNSLYCGLPQTEIFLLQIMQNAAERLLTGTKNKDNISSILASLHWLPVKFRIDFKIAVFVYKGLVLHQNTLVTFWFLTLNVSLRIWCQIALIQFFMCLFFMWCMFPFKAF